MAIDVRIDAGRWWQDDLLLAPAMQLRELLVRGELSAVELIDRVYARQAERHESVNAIVTPVPLQEARDRARAADRAVRAGRPLGALHGLPFTVKDLIEVQGLPCTAGSVALRDHISTRTAPAVARLIGAGAILIGKTNCAEFGVGNLHTGNRLFGDTRNPWDPTLTPGGSSGGDSAAIACGMAAFGIGTDYGGSVRWPAQCTGVTALRPTAGSVPNAGVLPWWSADPRVAADREASLHWRLQTVGVIARSAADLRAVGKVLAGDDSRAAAAPDRSRNPIGRLDGLACAWFTEVGDRPVTPQIAAAVADAARVVADCGAVVGQERPDGFGELPVLFDDLRVGDRQNELAGLVAGRRSVLTPLVARILAQAENPAADVPGVAAQAAAARMELLRRTIADFMQSWPVLLLPVSADLAFRPEPAEFIRVPSESRTWLEAPCRATSLLGLPVAVAICGTSADGRPVGVQIVGRHLHEDDVLRVAAALEQQFGRWRPARTAS